MSKRTASSAEAGESMDQAAQDELARTIEAQIRVPLESVKLELMPFRVEADGPANVSQFFLPEPTETWEQDFVSGNGASSISSSSSAAATPARQQPARFIANFRGREVVAFQVDLPEDSYGLVFVPEQSKPTANPSSSASVSKRARQAAVRHQAEDDEGGNGEAEVEDQDLPNLRWDCSQGFASLRVWNVDREHLGARTSVGRAIESQMALSRALHAPVVVDE